MFHGSIWWIFGAFAVISFLLRTAGSARGWKRLQNMAATAQELGFSYTPWIGPESGPQFGTPLFQRYSGGTLKNVMRGNFAGLDAQVFDYSYTVGPSARSTNATHTVVVYTREAGLPVFALEPSSLAGKLIDALEHQRVELDCAASFARHFAVHGTDKEKVRALFDARLVSFIEGLDRSKRWHVEGAGKTVVVYRPGIRVKPSEVRELLQETSPIAQAFFAYNAVSKASVGG